MSAETSWIRDIATGQRDMAGDQYVQGFEGQSSKFKPYAQRLELFEEFI